MGKRSSNVGDGSSNMSVLSDAFIVVNEKPKSYTSLTLPAIRDELKRRGLSPKGIKRELVWFCTASLVSCPPLTPLFVSPLTIVVLRADSL